MKIVYCLYRTFKVGGTERIVISKANWLAAHGYDVTIVTAIQFGRPDFFPLHPAIKRIDLDIPYDDIQSFGVFKKMLVRRKLIKLHRKKLEELLIEANADIVISTFGNEASFLPQIKDGSGKIVEIHFSRLYRLNLNRTGVWRLFNKYLFYNDARLLKKFDRFICLTPEDRQNWTNAENIEVIPNFVDAEESFHAPLQSKSMIAVGRLSYEKGYDRLIKAWKIVAQKYPDWTLNIFGTGELKSDLEKQISDANLSGKVNIHTPTKDIINEYLQHSALVLSSRSEGLPMVLLEAMKVGLPMISFACQCGPRDVIEDRHNGILVADGDIHGLANAIIEVIEDPALRQMLGNNAYKSAEKYKKDDIMRRWEALFNSIK